MPSFLFPPGAVQRDHQILDDIFLHYADLVS